MPWWNSVASQFWSLSPIPNKNYSPASPSPGPILVYWYCPAISLLFGDAGTNLETWNNFFRQLYVSVLHWVLCKLFSTCSSDQLEQGSQTSPVEAKHSGRREPAPANCPLIYTHTETHAHALKNNKQTYHIGKTHIPLSEGDSCWGTMPRPQGCSQDLLELSTYPLSTCVILGLFPE